MRQGLAAHRATGAEAIQPYYLACLAETYGQAGQPEEGLNVLAEAMARVDKTDEREYEAELYRTQGRTTLAQSSVQSLELESKKIKSQRAKVKNQKIPIPDPRPPLIPTPKPKRVF